MMTDLVKEHPADDNITRNLNSVEWLRYLLDDLIHQPRRAVRSKLGGIGRAESHFDSYVRCALLSEPPQLRPR